MREKGKPRVQGRVLIALAIFLMVQQYLFAPDFHAVHDDSWLAPVHILTAEELTGNPEPGSISCPSPLYPVNDRIVDQESNRRIPRMIHVSMKSRCLPVCRLSQTIVEKSFYRFLFYGISLLSSAHRILFLIFLLLQ
jgi:hypothetical protein